MNKCHKLQSLQMTFSCMNNLVIKTTTRIYLGERD